jgi:hypothetical protein
MRANPGGVLAVEDVIGRDYLISNIWSALEAQSIVLTSERRVGKTSVIRKMAGFPTEKKLCLLRDVEGYRSAGEFIEGIFSDVETVLSRKERARLAIFRLLEKLGGTEIGHLKLPQVKSHWKNLLNALFEDIFAEETRPVIFFWDELPLFLYNVKQASGEKDAMELLDSLRALRQKYISLRMVFTGSVGLHQVVSSLRKHGYANDPTNDMQTIEIPPLDPNDGAHLARLLLDGEAIVIDGKPDEIATALSEAAGHIPYYVHCLVSRICSTSRRISLAAVSALLDGLICDPNDPAHFQYYQNRLKTYYGDVEAKLALYALDALAGSQHSLSFVNLLNLVRHKYSDAGEETFRDVLQILQKDHYLHRHEDGTYGFRYSIVRKWWAGR